ncbi:MAG: hypothetical protein QN162_11500 [Armatimonadota bacterium]|nr:hypothetical protein [Armatimonadota bacterium]
MKLNDRLGLLRERNGPQGFNLPPILREVCADQPQLVLRQGVTGHDRKYCERIFHACLQLTA